MASDKGADIEKRTENEPPQEDGGERVPVPSKRLTAALAAAMLGVGVAVGAAIGPVPTSSFGVDAPLAALLRSLLAERPASHKPAATSQEPASETAPVSHQHAAPASQPSSEETSQPAKEETTPEPKPTAKKEPESKFPPVNRVWLIELSGAGFSEALAAPSTASYIDSQAIPKGSLLDGWSAIAASSFATSVAQLATKEASLVQTVVQPVCANDQECLPGTPGGLAAANAFLASTLPKLTASGSYSSNGLVVITFGTVASGTESELPAGSTTSLLASQPAAGALLISPYVAAGKRPTTTFDPASPKGSMEALLRR